jgi:hypothetical protein
LTVSSVCVIVSVIKIKVPMGKELIMASVIGSVTGGDPVRMEAETVADVKAELDLTGNYTATVNGETVSEDFVLADEDYVCFAQAVKGGSL